jgi:hypothetical protein
MEYKGIYILVTLDGYRIFVGNVLGIYAGYDSNGRFVLDESVVKHIFGGKQVFDNEDCALSAALELSNLTGELDDGIYWIRDIADKDFNEFVG